MLADWKLQSVGQLVAVACPAGAELLVVVVAAVVAVVAAAGTVVVLEEVAEVTLTTEAAPEAELAFVVQAGGVAVGCAFVLGPSGHSKRTLHIEHIEWADSAEVGVVTNRLGLVVAVVAAVVAAVVVAVVVVAAAAAGDIALAAAEAEAAVLVVSVPVARVATAERQPDNTKILVTPEPQVAFVATDELALVASMKAVASRAVADVVVVAVAVAAAAAVATVVELRHTIELAVQLVEHTALEDLALDELSGNWSLRAMRAAECASRPGVARRH